jgi:8-oxo-dGTP diphosphatase
MTETSLPQDAAYNPICTVDAVLLTIEGDCLKVLLHRRPKAPYEGRWALVGGYIHRDEDKGVLEAVQRIMRDKAGLPALHLEQLQTYSGPDRDPRGWSVSVAHLGLVPRAQLDLPDDPNVLLTDVEELPDLAFDHRGIIDDAVARLRGKSAYSTLPASLLDDLFTLPELHRAYEIILGLKLDPSSFRRKALDRGMIEDSGEMRTEGSKRPAKLYRLCAPAQTFDQTFAPQQF